MNPEEVFTPEQLAQLAADSVDPTKAVDAVEWSGYSPADVVAGLIRRAKQIAADPLHDANERLGLTGADRITAFLEERGDERRYGFVASDGTGWVTSRQFENWRDACRAIREATGMPPAELKRDAWRYVQALLLRAKTIVEVSAAETDQGRGAEWITAYLHDRHVADSIADAEGNMPFRHNGGVYLIGPAFRRWISVSSEGEGRAISSKEFGATMRAAGATPERIHVNGTTRSCWRLPETLEPAF